MLEKQVRKVYLDGVMFECSLLCPCVKQYPICSKCNGTGEFQPSLSEKEVFRASWELLESSDDPDSILEELS